MQHALIDSDTQNANVILVLLATNKTVLTKHARDIAQKLIYLTIGNLSHEIQRSQIKPGGIMVGLISINKRDSLKIKIEIYHQTIGIITRYKSRYHIFH